MPPNPPESNFHRPDMTQLRPFSSSLPSPCPSRPPPQPLSTWLLVRLPLRRCVYFCEQRYFSSPRRFPRHGKPVSIVWKTAETGFHGMELFLKLASMPWETGESGFHGVELFRGCRKTTTPPAGSWKGVRRPRAPHSRTLPLQRHRRLRHPPRRTPSPRPSLTPLGAQAARLRPPPGALTAIDCNRQKRPRAVLSPPCLCVRPSLRRLPARALPPPLDIAHWNWQHFPIGNMKRVSGLETRRGPRKPPLSAAFPCMGGGLQFVGRGCNLLACGV